MKLLNEKEIEEAAKSDMWFESIGTPSSDFQLGFRIGAGVAEQKLMPLFVEFGTWIAENYRPTVAMQELRYWQKGSYQNKDYFYSTEELLEQFIEQRNK